MVVHIQGPEEGNTVAPPVCVCLGSVPAAGIKVATSLSLSLPAAARKQLFVSFQSLGKRLFRLLRVKNNSDLKGKKKKALFWSF